MLFSILLNTNTKNWVNALITGVLVLFCLTLFSCSGHLIKLHSIIKEFELKSNSNKEEG